MQGAKIKLGLNNKGRRSWKDPKEDVVQVVRNDAPALRRTLMMPLCDRTFDRTGHNLPRVTPTRSQCPHKEASPALASGYTASIKRQLRVCVVDYITSYCI